MRLAAASMALAGPRLMGDGVRAGAALQQRSTCGGGMVSSNTIAAHARMGATAGAAAG